MEQPFACGFHYMHMYNVQLTAEKSDKDFCSYEQGPHEWSCHFTEYMNW